VTDRRASRADARKRDILRAAAAAFREHGFARAGMREIAAKADLSAANLYYYFPSKDALLYDCQDEALERLLAVVASARRGHARAADALRAVIAEHLRTILGEVEAGAAHLAVDALPPRLRAKIVEKRDRYEKAVRAVVARGLRDGSLAGADATLATRALLGALNATAAWWRPDGPIPLDDAIERLTHQFARGLEA
jgi:AcrR family transcriptional regulator